MLDNMTSIGSKILLFTAMNQEKLGYCHIFGKINFLRSFFINLTLYKRNSFIFDKPLQITLLENFLSAFSLHQIMKPEVLTTQSINY